MASIQLNGGPNKKNWRKSLIFVFAAIEIILIAGYVGTFSFFTAMDITCSIFDINQSIAIHKVFSSVDSELTFSLTFIAFFIAALLLNNTARMIIGISFSIGEKNKNRRDIMAANTARKILWIKLLLSFKDSFSGLKKEPKKIISALAWAVTSFTIWVSFYSYIYAGSNMSVRLGASFGWWILILFSYLVITYLGSKLLFIMGDEAQKFSAYSHPILKKVDKSRAKGSLANK